MTTNKRHKIDMGKPPYTADWDMFDEHETNRELRIPSSLVKSMKTDGYWPSHPIQCIRNGHGKLKIISGNTRFNCAKRLGLGVYYVVDEINTDLYAREGDTHGVWKLRDFVYSKTRAGNQDYAILLSFSEQYHLPLGAAASLLVNGQQSGGRGVNMSRLIKSGAFRVGDTKHAYRVVTITDRCREKGITFATASSFVSALSSTIRAGGFDVDDFLDKISKYPKKMEARSDVFGYIEEIGGLYNYRRQGARKPIAFNAAELIRQKRT